MEEIEDPIVFIRHCNSLSLSVEEKLNLKRSQKRPHLNLTQKDGKTYRKFQNSWYETFRWMTGSLTTNAVYCFPCLLFGGDDTAWTKDGITVMKNFVQKAHKHATSKKHITCNEFFTMLGEVRKDYALVEAEKTNALRHNENVAKNRHIIGQLIDVVCFLAKQELGFRGHDKTASLKTKCNYLELLNLIATENKLESRSVFKDTSSDVQNDLIESVSYVVHQTVFDELKNTDFVSVQVDETTDVSCWAQYSIILRFIYNNEVVERFIGFHYLSDDKMAVKILEVLNSLQVTDKLVCQTYDGASGHKGGVQTIIKQTCPRAIFIHCYAHQLNLVLLHCSRQIHEVKLFSGNLTKFKTFFVRSPLRVEQLRKAGFSIPRGSDTKWNFHSRSIFSIFENYDSLIKITNFVEASDKFDLESTNLATALNKILNNSMFALILCLFYKIFVFSDHLYSVLQSKIISNPAICFQEVEQTIMNISKLRTDETVSLCLQECRKLTNKEILETFIPTFKRVAFEVLDTVVNEMKERFKDINELSFIELFNKNKYQEHLKKKKLFQTLSESYPNTFNILKLENELLVIYSCDIKKNLEPFNLFRYICDNDLNDVFSETSKLLKLLLTMPITNVSSEKSMSMLKRIKTYLRNSMSNERLSSAVATLSIEQEIVGKYNINPKFKDKVIDHFAMNKTSRLQLLFKKI